MKKIELFTGYLPAGKLKYRGEYIYKVVSTREGEKGLGEGFPKPEFLELELEGVGGIKGKLEKEIAITVNNPLDCRGHKYYCLEHGVWIKKLGNEKYVSDWTIEEKWAIAEEVTYDEAGQVTARRELGFMIIRNDRRNGIIV